MKAATITTRKHTWEHTLGHGECIAEPPSHPTIEAHALILLFILCRMADTLSCFDRVPAVIEHDLLKNEQRLVNFTVDEKPSDK